MQPTAEQISAAHDAWEQVVTEWKLRRVSNHGMGSDIWVLERRGAATYDHGRDYANEIAAYKFDGKDAERQAKFMLREKCIVAALTAALKI